MAASSAKGKSPTPAAQRSIPPTFSLPDALPAQLFSKSNTALFSTFLQCPYLAVVSLEPTVILPTMSTRVYCLVEDGHVGPSSRTDNRVGAFTHVLSPADLAAENSLYSPWVNFAGFKWRLLIFPKGNGSDSFLAVYLDCGGPSAETSSSSGTSAYERYNGEHLEWAKLAVFSLHLLHSESPVARACVRGDAPNMDDVYTEMAGDVVKDTSHRFREALRDWGFLEFAPRTLLEPGSHVDAAGNATLMVMIKVHGSFEERLLDETEAWDSKRETGFVGLAKRGDVGYLNVVLQSMYHIGAVRKAILHMPVQEGVDDQTNNVLRALHDVFFRMQFRKRTVWTTELTYALGWDMDDSDVEHDVSEVKQLLLNDFIDKMKDCAPGETAELRELIQGRLQSRVECVDADYVSEKEETFCDISLDVRNCSNLLDSFNKFVEPEILDGESRIELDGFESAQVARKRLMLAELPPVLQINLKRFRYDSARKAIEKIMERHEFDVEIDLGAYVACERAAQVYVLYSVIVHKGSLSDGSYHTFIRPYLDMNAFENQSSQHWFKFDNSVVTPASEDEAVSDNYGEAMSATPGEEPYGTPRCKTATACVLIYLRRSDLKKLLKEPRWCDLPEHVLRLHAKKKRSSADSSQD